MSGNPGGRGASNDWEKVEGGKRRGRHGRIQNAYMMRDNPLNNNTNRPTNTTTTTANHNHNHNKNKEEKAGFSKDEETFLCECFSNMEVGLVKDIYASCGYDAEAAMKKIMEEFQTPVGPSSFVPVDCAGSDDGADGGDKDHIEAFADFADQDQLGASIGQSGSMSSLSSAEGMINSVLGDKVDYSATVSGANLCLLMEMFENVPVSELVYCLYCLEDVEMCVACLVERKGSLSGKGDELWGDDGDQRDDDKSFWYSVMTLKDLFPHYEVIGLYNLLKSTGGVDKVIEALLGPDSRRHSSAGGRESGWSVWKAPEQKGDSLSTKMKFNQLAEMYPDIGRVLLKELFEESNFNVDKTHIAIQKIIPGIKPKAIETVRKFETDHASGKVVVDHLTKERRLVESSETNKQNETATSIGKFVDAHAMLVEDREYAESRIDYHLAQRERNFVKASEAHARRQFEVAAYYGAEGRTHDVRYKELKQQLALGVMCNRLKTERKGNTILSLDLHNFPVKEALSSIERMMDAVTSNEGSGSRNRGKTQLYIITGRGAHSRKGKAVLKPHIARYLENNNIRFEEVNNGCLLAFL
eukprot:Nk52_evm6s136 gene=Nk52_evmTU6s136